MKCFNFSIRRAELKIYQGHFLLRVCLCVSVCVCVCVSICVSMCVQKHTCHSAQNTCVEATWKSWVSFPIFLPWFRQCLISKVYVCCATCHGISGILLSLQPTHLSMGHWLSLFDSIFPHI